MTLVIMAAGMGSRFGGLKQIEPINENQEYLIDYSIYDAINAGFDNVVCIIKEELYEIFRDTFGKRIEKHIKVKYVFQKLEDLPSGFKVPVGRVKPWGTVQALLACKDVIDENFAVINADDFYGRDAFLVMSNFADLDLESKEILLSGMVGYKVINTLTEHGAVKRAVCDVDGEYLSRLIESKVKNVDGNIVAEPLDGTKPFNIKSDTVVAVNLFVFSPKIFEYFEKMFINFLKYNEDNLLECECLISDVIDKLITNNEIKMKVLDTNSKYLGITYKEDKPKVEKEIKEMVKNKEYPKNLWG